MKHLLNRSPLHCALHCALHRALHRVFHRVFLWALLLPAVPMAPAAAYDGLVIVEEDLVFDPDSDPMDEFGDAVAIGASTLAVGSPLDDTLGTSSGSVCIYAHTGTSWTFVSKIFAPDGTSMDYFGTSVDVTEDGALLVVGAPGADGAALGSGAAYEFHFDGTTWIFLGKLIAFDGAASDFFGESVAISDSGIVVGAPLDDDLGLESGAAYTFDVGGGMGDKLIAPDGAMDDHFGFDVDIADHTLIVGAWGDDHSGIGFGAGSAYIYDKAGSVWMPADKLFAPDATPGALFGVSVSITGSHRVAVGAMLDMFGGGAESGSAYVFEGGGGSWGLVDKLLPADPMPFTHFGADVSIHDGLVAVGRPEVPAGGAGSAYLFLDAGTGHTQIGKLSQTGAATGDGAGNSVDLNGLESLAFGAPKDDDAGFDSGSASVWKIVPEFMPYCTSLPNSLGAIAGIAGSGSTSLDANDMVLSAGPVPNNFGLYFYGASTTFVPMANGMRCVGAPLYRLPVEVATGNVLTHALDLTSLTPAGAISAGETWFFQAWYRDPAAAGADANTSRGLAATFVP